MLENLVNELPQLGIGVVAMLVLLAVLYFAGRYALESVKAFRSELDEARKEREKNQAVFMEFVQSNNHKVTELVEASTRAIVEGSEAIRQSSVYIAEATKALTVYNDRMRDPRP